MEKKTTAFTLAEVLIAMVIIGIISVFTIPSFLANTTGKRHRVAFQKAINTLARAATANYGTAGYDFSGANGFYGTVNNPTPTYNIAGGAVDAPIIGEDTQSLPGGNTFSDLHPDTTSLFHIWHDNLSLRHSAELFNYAVSPAEISLNCASRPKTDSVQLHVIGAPDVTESEIKSEYPSREYWSESVIQGSGNLFPMCDGRTLADGGINQGRMFQLEDGMVFTYDPSQAYCLETNPCYGYIDVNGPEGPNRVIACSEGEDSFITTYSKNAPRGMLLANCTVKNADITDIYPVLFYNNVVKPGSWAAKSVFYQLKTNQVEASGEPDTDSPATAGE